MANAEVNVGRCYLRKVAKAATKTMRTTQAKCNRQEAATLKCAKSCA